MAAAAGTRWLVYRSAGGKYQDGLGDQLRGIISAAIAAVLSNRVLLLEPMRVIER